MNDPTYIVIRDSDSTLCDFREGDVLDEANARKWEHTGILLLPVHAPSLPQRGALGSLTSTGYQRHVYGSVGVRFDGMRFQRGCTAAICMPGNTARVEWMAQLADTGEAEVNAQLRLVAEETAHGFLRVTDPVIGPCPGRNLIRASAIVSGTDRCFGAVSLAGACDGVRVLWLAVTVLPR